MKTSSIHLLIFMLILSAGLVACGESTEEQTEATESTEAEAGQTDYAKEQAQKAAAKAQAQRKGIRVENGQQMYETDEFSIVVPEAWNIDLSGRMNTRMIIFAPYDSTSNIFRENVNMLIDPVGDSLNLDAYIENAKGILSSKLPGFGNYRERKEEDRTWLFYDGSQENMVLHYSQMMAQDGNDIYILTFTSNASDSKNEAQAQDIMRTFRIK